MKNVSFVYKFGIFLLLSLLYVGCANTSNIQYPKPFERPQPQKYEFKIIELDGIRLYTLDEENSKIMIENWINYKSWAESNFQLLNKLYINK